MPDHRDTDPPNVVRVAVYDHMKDPHATPAARRRGMLLTAYVDARPHWQLVASYRDADTASGHRPALAQVLAAATQGSFDVLLVTSLDRLARRVTQLGPVLTQLGEAVVTLRCAADALDTSSTAGRVFAAVLTALAEHDANPAHKTPTQVGSGTLTWTMPVADASTVHNALGIAQRHLARAAREAHAGAHREPTPDPDSTDAATISVAPTVAGYRRIEALARAELARYTSLAATLLAIVEAADPPG